MFKNLLELRPDALIKVSLIWMFPQPDNFDSQEAKRAGFRKVKDIDNTYELKMKDL